MSLLSLSKYFVFLSCHFVLLLGVLLSALLVLCSLCDLPFLALRFESDTQRKSEIYDFYERKKQRKKEKKQRKKERKKFIMVSALTANFKVIKF